MFLALIIQVQAETHPVSYYEQKLKEAEDWDKPALYNRLYWGYSSSNIQTAFEYAMSGYELAKKIGNQKEESGLLGCIIDYYLQTDNATKVMEYAELSLEMVESNEELDLPFTYLITGNTIKSINPQRAYLLLQKVINMDASVWENSVAGYEWANALANFSIGNIYESYGEIKNAKKYYYESIDFYNRIDNQESINLVLTSLSDVLIDEGNYEEAIKFINTMKSNHKKFNNIKGLIDAYIQEIELLKGKGDFNLCLHIIDTLDYLYTTSDLYIGVYHDIQLTKAKVFKQLNRNREILELILPLYDSANTKNQLDKIAQYAKLLSFAYLQLGNKEESIAFQDVYTSALNTSLNQLKQDKLKSFNVVYNFTRERDSIAFAQQNEKLLIETERKNTQRITLTVFGVLVLIIIFFLYLNRVSAKKNKVIKEKSTAVEAANEELQVTNEELQQQSEELAAQRDKIEEAHKIISIKSNEITVSIQYAKRIQQAILPSLESFRTHFDNYFILYKPKDIVSGDLYWLESTQDFICLALVDCTGHGVSGAMMTLIADSLLKKAVLNDRMSDPKNILTYLNQNLVEELKQEKTGGNEGMDLSICLFEKKDNDTYNLKFAGAKSDLYLKNGQDIQIFKGNRHSIGGGKFEGERFHTYQLEVHKGDKIYLSTDGYMDQNNDARKRFGKKRFYSLLNEVQSLTFKEGSEKIEQTLFDYKGKAEQRDDIALLALQI